MKDQVIEMLSSGIGAAAVASALGLTDSAISQILSEEGIAEAVSEKRAARFHQFSSHDAAIHSAEEKALEKLGRAIDFAVRPGELARIFQILNSAKRVTTDQGLPQQAPSTTVTIHIPEAARVEFTVTQEKQVVEIQGRSMAPLPASNVTQLLQARRLLQTQVPVSLLESSL